MTILDRLRQHGLHINVGKCQFTKPSIEFLGYSISHDTVSMNPKKLDCIASWPEPSNKNDVQQFLGFCNFYRRFIRKYADLSLPLTNLLKKGSSFNFGTNEKKAFQSLKSAFLQSPSLGIFDPTLDTFIEVDASDFAIGAVLCQKTAIKSNIIIATHSRKLSKHELNYSVHDKELLSIIDALKHWRHYLIPSPFVIFTDHRNLEYFMDSKILNQRQIRWAEYLADFSFSIVYRPGVDNAGADSLSRRSDYKSGHESQEMTLLPGYSLYIASISSVMGIQEFHSRIKDLSINDAGYQEKLKTLPIGYSLRDDLLYFNDRLFLPENEEILHYVYSICHDSPLAGHFGQQKTLDLISRYFYWPRMTDMVKSYVSSCPICQKAKPVRQKPAGQLLPLPIPSRPWDSISMDFITKLPSSDGFNSILVVVDRYSKMTHLIPCLETISSQLLINILFKEIFRLHGFPSSIITDRGPVFASSFVRDLYHLLKIQPRFSSAYHPETDGQTERLNGIIQQYLRAFIDGQQQLGPVITIC